MDPDEEGEIPDGCIMDKTGHLRVLKRGPAPVIETLEPIYDGCEGQDEQGTARRTRWVYDVSKRGFRADTIAKAPYDATKPCMK